MKFLKTLLPILLFTQAAWGAAKLQDADFMSAAQITGAGGTISQLLNDTKCYVSTGGLNEQLSTALTNGDISNLNAATVKDTGFKIISAGDATKIANTDLSSATTGTTSTLVFSQTVNRTITMPNATDTLVGRATADTLTNKTLGDALTFTQIATPANPAAGLNKCYVKGDQKFYCLSSAGVESLVGPAAASSSPLTTKGDLYTFTAADARLAVGANGEVLSADSTTATGLKWIPVAGTGTVTSVDLTMPAEFSVSGNPVTTSGTLAVTKANQNANLGFFGPAAGAAAAPTFRALVPLDIPALDFAKITTGVVPILQGGTGQTTANAGFNALSPMTTLGDLIYEDGTPIAARLAGNTTAVKQFLTQTGTGAISAAPAWAGIVAGDVPSLDFSKITTGTVPIAQGGTGQTTQTAAFDALSPLTTKGDILTRNGANNVRFAVCPDGDNMQADSTTATGWKCVTPSGGGGGTDFPVTSYTADATITNAEYDVYLDPAAGTGIINITLFAATGNPGHHLNFTQISEGTVNYFTVGGETIGYNGDTDAQTNKKGNLTIGSNGANWYVQ